MRKHSEDDPSGALPDRDRLGEWPLGVAWLTTEVPLVRVTGELTGDIAIQLRNTVYAHLARGSRLVVVDLRSITSLPPDGIAALVHIAYEAGDASIGLCLVAELNGNHPVGPALRGAGVCDLFDIHPDPTAALHTLI
jgi:hypothetical protein